MDRETDQRLRLDFAQLPLVEAAVRASLQSPVVLTYASVNTIAASLKSDFPILTEPREIEIPPGVGGQVQFGPANIPGAVYEGNERALRVSVHPQVVVARWIKQFGPIDRPYPRFPALRDALWAATNALQQVMGEGCTAITVVNMSYVNFLPCSEPAEIVKKYLSDAAQLGAMSQAQRVRKLDASWSPSEGLDVRFALEQATAQWAGEPQEGYRLTTAAGTRLDESLDARSGLERVHRELQTFFLNLISDYAKVEWQLKEVRNA